MSIGARNWAKQTLKGSDRTEKTILDLIRKEDENMWPYHGEFDDQRMRHRAGCRINVYQISVEALRDGKELTDELIDGIGDFQKANDPNLGRSVCSCCGERGKLTAVGSDELCDGCLEDHEGWDISAT